VLWENVAYLADDVRRTEALAMLREEVGLDPKRIRKVPAAALAQVSRKGILPAESVEKLRACAEIALSEFGGDLRAIRDLPLPAAKKALQKFPSIGEPAAERILLFAGIHPVFSMDSNVLRVLLRLGYGKEQKSYAASYRSVREALAPELPGDCVPLIAAYQLLRRHGQRLCKRSKPRCEVCPLRSGCAYGRP
jgi:endonuclease III